jgi:phosphopentomutase
MKRAFIMVLDSFGIGATEDAERFGDVGSDTMGHIAEACAKGEADNGRKGPLTLPNLTRLGLVKAHEGSTGKIAAGMDGNAEVVGAYAWAHELSSGKDTPSGHWEIAGVPVLFDWGYFSDHENSFPQELLDKLVKRANLPGYLGNCHSSGIVTGAWFPGPPTGSMRGYSFFGCQQFSIFIFASDGSLWALMMKLIDACRERIFSRK